MRQVVTSRLHHLGLPAEEKALACLARHAQLLGGWHGSVHLVSQADLSPARLVRHYLESLAALPLLPPQGRLVDVGSGGGFPGLIWSLFRRRQEVVLVEREARKAAFLRDAAQQFSLDHLSVVEESISRPARLVKMGAVVLTSRAAGLGELLIQAGLQSSPRPWLFLYQGRSPAAGERETPPGYTVSKRMPLGPEGGGGRLLVLAPHPAGAA